MKWLMRMLGILWIPGGVAIFLIYLNSQNWRWDWETGWSTITACATWVLAGGIFFVFWQIMEARRSTNAQIAMDLFRELRSDETLERLRFIYSLKPEEDKQTLHTIDKDSIDYVIDRLNILGTLVASGIVDRQLAIETYGGFPAIRCWYKLYKYIREEQKKRGYYHENYEDFTHCCLEHFDSVKIRVYLEGEKEDLVKIIKNRLDTEFRPRSAGKIKKDREKDKREVQS